MPPWLTALLGSVNMTQLITAAFAALGTIGGTWATIKIAGIKGKPEVQTTLNEGFTKLVNEFQEERTSLLHRIDAQDTRIFTMQVTITSQTLRIYQLEAAMKGAGIPLPPEVVG